MVPPIMHEKEVENNISSKPTGTVVIPSNGASYHSLKFVLNSKKA
jgi:hypothetical protein